MSDGPKQQQMFETEDAQSLLDYVLADSRLHAHSAECEVVLGFTGACETAQTPADRLLAAIWAADGDTTQSSPV